MLTITVSGTEGFNEETGKFVRMNGTELKLEHSLVSLSKWESQYEKPFLGKESKTAEEILDYVKHMCLTSDTPGGIFEKLSPDNFETINTYISAKMTGTMFPNVPGASNTRETISAELVYYWMTAYNIPFECETWHLNRLFTLIRVCNIKQDTGKEKKGKISKSEQARQRSEMNARRKTELNTKG